MSLRGVWLLVVFALSCGGESMKVKKGEPQTAREKMLAEEKAKSEKEKDEDPPGKQKWTSWRYQGDRKDCRFVLGRRCYKSENAACQAARCKAPLKCSPEGAGPATMKCAK